MSDAGLVWLDLLVAALLGAVIGFQRQYTNKPAGIRTHSLVSLGACAFATYSALLHETRIAAGVITGIGFLGAGAIVRHGFTTRGLTTAASIWTASAIGMAVGLGHIEWYPIALALTVLTLVLLSITDESIMRLLPRRTMIAIDVDIDLDRCAVAAVRDEIARHVERVHFSEGLSIARVDGARRATIGYIIRLDVNADLPRVFTAISALDGVLRIAVADETATPSV